MIDKYKEFFEDLENELNSHKDYYKELVNKLFKKIKDEHNIEIVNPKTLETITNLFEIEKKEDKYLRENIEQLHKIYTNKGGYSCLTCILDGYDYLNAGECYNDFCEICVLKAFIRLNILKIIKLKGE